MTMAISKPPSMPATALISAIRDRSLTSLDLVDRCLSEITACDGALNAFIDLYRAESQANAAARDNEVRANYFASPLHGIPVAVKDCVHVQGHPTTAGSPFIQRSPEQPSAVVVQRLISAGLVVIGKTNMVEYAMGGWGTSRHFGTPRNPWDRVVPRVPGGSSSGSAVAVAAGLVPLSIGTDTGGSVRLPAAFCGVVGLKPTKPRVSLEGIVPLSPTLDSCGPIARSVDDCALLYEVMRERNSRDGEPEEDIRSALSCDPTRLRLASLPDHEREGVAPAVLANYDRSLAVLEKAGARIEQIHLPWLLSSCSDLAGPIILTEAYSSFGHLAEDPSVSMDEIVRQRLLSAREISSATYQACLSSAEAMWDDFAKTMSGFDALLTPTTETTAIPVHDVDPRRLPTRFTRAVNVLDCCALALPNGFCERGLPTSLQVVCREFDEVTALRIGKLHEVHTQWRERVPNL